MPPTTHHNKLMATPVACTPVPSPHSGKKTAHYTFSLHHTSLRCASTLPTRSYPIHAHYCTNVTKPLHLLHPQLPQHPYTAKHYYAWAPLTQQTPRNQLANHTPSPHQPPVNATEDVQPTHPNWPNRLPPVINCATAHQSQLHRPRPHVCMPSITEPSNPLPPVLTTQQTHRTQLLYPSQNTNAALAAQKRSPSPLTNDHSPSTHDHSL